MSQPTSSTTVVARLAAEESGLLTLRERHREADHLFVTKAATP